MTEPIVNHKKHRLLTLRLDTVLLLMTLAAVGVAYFKSYGSRVEWQSRLNRLEASSGLPRVHDVLKLEIAAARKYEKEHLAWTVWVPQGQTCRLRVATTELVDEFPSKFDEYRLHAGRHRIAVFCDSISDKSELNIDGKKVVDRERTTISLPSAFSLSGFVHPTRPKSEMIFQAFGSVRLRADEEYDPVKHRFGLQVWIMP
jgi:hypothetical protein